MDPQVEPGQPAAAIGIVLLPICVLFWIFHAFYSLPDEDELVEVAGEITEIELHDGRRGLGVRWFTLRSKGEMVDLCIADLWRSLRIPEVGDQLSVKGYEPTLGPCDYQAMEVSHKDKVLVSYASFTHRKSHKLEFFGFYFIGPVALAGLILFVFGYSRNRKWKLRNRGL